jgi:O-antigen ligase
LEISKRNLINTLFVMGFPFYGVGFYLGVRYAFSAGQLFSVAPFLLILIIHGIDLIYRGYAVNVVNRIYWLGMAFLVSMTAGMWMAFYKGFPGFLLLNTLGQTIMFFAPFNAAIVVQVINRDNKDFDFPGMFLKSLIILMVVNFIGYGAGFSNLVHAFPGRVSLPFMRGLYDASHLLSMINLMLLFQFRDFTGRPLRFLGMLAFYLANLALMVNVNSRLSFLAFLIITVLFVTRIIRTTRLLYSISLFTMPLLLSFALLIYEVLTLPIFTAVLSRVSKHDVTSFNGRSYLWYGAFDWFMTDRRGLWFGGGYNAQAGLGFMDRIGVLWGVETPNMIHMHSSFLQILLAQGIVGLLLMYAVMWQIYSFYRKRYMSGASDASLFAVVVYLLFIWQIDIFCYGMDFGIPIIFVLLSFIAVDQRLFARNEPETTLAPRS